MGYLLVSIVTAALNAAVLKRGEVRKHNRLVVAGANYICATLLSVAAWLLGPPAQPGALILGLGVVGGFFFATSLIVLMGAVGKAGIAIATAAYRMSLVWPVLLSIFVFGEIPGKWQAAGISIALLAILLLTLSAAPRSSNMERGSAVWLAGIFLMGGGPFSTMKTFTELGAPAEKQLMLATIFFFGCVFCWAAILVKRISPRREEMKTGAMFGVLNFSSNLSLLYGLQTVPGMLAFPIFNSSIMLLATLLGVAIWKEKPGIFGYFALGVSVFAIVLMNL